MRGIKIFSFVCTFGMLLFMWRGKRAPASQMIKSPLPTQEALGRRPGKHTLQLQAPTQEKRRPLKEDHASALKLLKHAHPRRVRAWHTGIKKRREAMAPLGEHQSPNALTASSSTPACFHSQMHACPLQLHFEAVVWQGSRMLSGHRTNSAAQCSYCLAQLRWAERGGQSRWACAMARVWQSSTVEQGSEELRSAV
eukprot:1161183-Pelagomonas_calceolata.AAC.5